MGEQSQDEIDFDRGEWQGTRRAPSPLCTSLSSHDCARNLNIGCAQYTPDLAPNGDLMSTAQSLRIDWQANYVARTRGAAYVLALQ